MLGLRLRCTAPTLAALHTATLTPQLAEAKKTLRPRTRDRAELRHQAKKRDGALRGVRRAVARAPHLQRPRTSSTNPAKAYGIKLGDDVPTFTESWRRFLIAVHPDRLRHSSEAADINSESLRQLTELVESLKTKGQADTAFTYPPSGLLKLTFVIPPQRALPTATESDTKYTDLDMTAISVSFRTTGGDCSGLVKRSFGQLFKACGINEQFEWEPGYWGVRTQA